MRWSPRAMRIGLVASFALPALIILASSALQAQPRPPFPQPPRPPIGPPQIERVWTCGKCGREIGRGAFPPGTCPHCGVRIINGVGGGPINPPPINPNPPFMPQPQPVIAPQPPPVQNIGNDTEPDRPQARPARASNTGLIIALALGLLIFAVLGVTIISAGVYLLVMRKKPRR